MIIQSIDEHRNIVITRVMAERLLNLRNALTEQRDRQQLSPQE